MIRQRAAFHTETATSTARMVELTEFNECEISGMSDQANIQVNEGFGLCENDIGDSAAAQFRSHHRRSSWPARGEQSDSKPSVSRL